MLNQKLIASQAPGSGQGMSYDWLDGNVEANVTYYYWLEDVDVSGVTTRHGPMYGEHESNHHKRLR